MKKHPILILAGNDLVATALVHALAFQEFDTFVAASEPYAHALYLVSDERRISLRHADDPNYLSDLIAQCAENKIRVVIPSGDGELLFLAKARDKFQSHGIDLLLSGTKGLEICMDRQRLTDTFSKVVAMPASQPVDDQFQTGEWRFPVIVRKRFCEDGDEVGVAQTPAELDRMGWGDDLIAQTYLGGERYIVELLIDGSGTPVFSLPIVELKNRTSTSTAYRTIHDHDTELQELAFRAVSHLGLTHAASVRFQRDRDDSLYLTNVTPRFSRMLPLVIAAGFNPVTTSLRSLLGISQPSRPTELADMAMIPGSDPLFLPCQEIERLEDMFFRARLGRNG